MIRCTRYRPHLKGSLRAFVDLALTNTGSLTGSGGVTRWTPMVEFIAGATRQREQFQKQALEAIHAAAAEQEVAR